MIIECVLSGAIVLSGAFYPGNEKNLLDPLLLLAFTYMRSMPEEVDSTLIEISDDNFVAEEPFHEDNRDLITDLWGDEEAGVDSEDDEYSVKSFARPFCACHTLPWSVNYEKYVRHSPSSEGSAGTEQPEADNNQEDSQPEEESCTTPQVQEASQQSSSETPGERSLKQAIECWRSKALLIGSGTFSDAFLLQRVKDGVQKKIVAKVRKTVTNQTDDQLVENLLKEVRQLLQLKHQGIVKLIAHEENKSEKLVVLYLEYLPYSFKELILSSQRFEKLKEFKCRLSAHGFGDMFMCILDALEYLHEKNVLYIDLKSSNLMFNEDGEVKLIDFGSLFKVEPESKPSSVIKCYHLAPEIRAGGLVTKRGQMYGVGLLIIEVLLSKYLEDRENIQYLIGLAQRSQQKYLIRSLVIKWGEFAVEQYIKVLKEVAYPCCCIKPENRPSIEAVKDCLERVMEDIDLNEADSDDDSSDVDEQAEDESSPVKEQKVEPVGEEPEND
ncbi:protein kinase domain-containing protein [Endozoicomonas lisbonensis]|uniref:tRNA A-37 threonylcarbamoyl transferase component Bud32 n=1 Tax=Endozoicomonas lisbonensis TaxID=3120522 RepID=A0ABV2SDI7_9GAMM